MTIDKKRIALVVFILILVLIVAFFVYSQTTGRAITESNRFSLADRLVSFFSRGKVTYECSDGVDNDKDGYCDFYTTRTRCKDGSKPGDQDCSSKEDNFECKIVCSADSACGSAYESGVYCGADGNVYKDYFSYTCQNPGSCSAACQEIKTPVLVQSCAWGCFNGSCKSQPTHLECIGSMCTKVNGTGINQCNTEGVYCNQTTNQTITNQTVTNSCTDTDKTVEYPDGKNIYLRGAHKNYTDVCYTGSSVNEYWCCGVSGDEDCVNQIGCPSGYSCVNGACVGGTVQCGNNACEPSESCSSCPTDCGVCDPGTAGTCTDTDRTTEYPDGKNIFARGSHKGFIDDCYLGVSSIEHWCCPAGADGDCVSYIGCPSGYNCTNGACRLY